MLHLSTSDDFVRIEQDMAFNVDSNFENVFLGVSSVSGSSTYRGNLIGGYDVALGAGIGSNTPENTSSGFLYNVVLGPTAMASAQDARSNIAFGSSAGQNSSNTEANIFQGIGAGFRSVSMYSNIIIGHSSSEYQSNASNNVFLGYGVGYGTESVRPSNNHYNVVIGDGSMRFGSNNSSNIVLGVLTMNESSGNSNNVCIGHSNGPFTSCRDVFSIGNGNLKSFRGESNIFIGNGIGESTTVSKTIGIGHGVDVSGLANKIVIGNSNHTYFYADMSSNTVMLGGRNPTYTLGTNNQIVSNTISDYLIRVNGPIFNPALKFLLVSTGDVLPTFPYIFINPSSTATYITLPTDLSDSLSSNSYNTNITIVNQTVSAITLCGVFYEANKTMSKTITRTLSANTLNTFTKVLFVNPEAPYTQDRYFIGYIQ